jgi:hypothetical protein
MASTLCIVSVYRPHLMVGAPESLGVTGDVKVIMDRRVGERRLPERAQSEESRRNDRRRRNIEEQLRTQGFAIVPVD